MDNFPRTREQFTSMIERNIVPDELICLKDDSENGELLLKRWFQTNKEGNEFKKENEEHEQKFTNEMGQA